MDFGYRSRDPLLLIPNNDTTGCSSDTDSRAATEVCEEFYDTLVHGISKYEAGYVTASRFGVAKWACTRSTPPSASIVSMSRSSVV